jgi:1,4-dihydroxy-2-naphthoate octaprenyltransferase
VSLRDFAAIVELRTKAVSVTTFWLGTLAAAWSEERFSWPVAVLSFAAVLCVDMGTTAFNTFFDFERRVDDPRFNREEDKILVHRGFAPGWAVIAGLGLFALAGMLGLVLALLRGIGVLFVGGTGMLVGLLYNAGPRPISHTPFGELAAGGFLGAVLFLLSYYLQAGRLGADAWMMSLPPFLLVASILTVNNTCDIDGDRAAGRRTLSIAIGPRLAEALVYTQGIAAYALTGLMVRRGSLPGAAAVTGAVAFAWTLVSYLRMHLRGFSHATKGASMRAIVGVLVAYGAAMAAAVVRAILAR